MKLGHLVSCLEYWFYTECSVPFTQRMNVGTYKSKSLKLKERHLRCLLNRDRNKEHLREEDYSITCDITLSQYPM